MAIIDIKDLVELRDSIASSKARALIQEEIGLGMRNERVQTSAEWANNFEVKSSHSAATKASLEKAVNTVLNK